MVEVNILGKIAMFTKEGCFLVQNIGLGTGESVHCSQ